MTALAINNMRLLQYHLWAWIRWLNPCPIPRRYHSPPQLCQNCRAKQCYCYPPGEAHSQELRDPYIMMPLGSTNNFKPLSNKIQNPTRCTLHSQSLLPGKSSIEYGRASSCGTSCTLMPHLSYRRYTHANTQSYIFLRSRFAHPTHNPVGTPSGYERAQYPTCRQRGTP